MVNKSSANYYQKQRKPATKTPESYQNLLTITIKFMSSKDTDKERLMHPKVIT